VLTNVSRAAGCRRDVAEVGRDILEVLVADAEDRIVERDGEIDQPERRVGGPAVVARLVVTVLNQAGPSKEKKAQGDGDDRRDDRRPLPAANEEGDDNCPDA